ncbi:MAG: hypothetical protein B6245_15865 [Desulfobacteraceae bacterium 4572_88]|nr:MAG: hypothetical protein B6245_15865 [Desulfobacteraceae bacterium 4572_88]
MPENKMLKNILMLKRGGVVSLVGAGGKTTLMFRLAQELSASGASVLTTTTTKIFMPDEHQSPHVVLSPSLAEVLKNAKHLLKNTLHLSAGSAHLSSGNKLLGFTPEGVDMLWKSGIFRWILVEADGAARRPLKAPASHEPVIPKSSGWIIGLAGLDVVGKPLTEQWVFRPERYADITGTALGEPVTEASLVRAILHSNGIFGAWKSPLAKYLVFLNKADCRQSADVGQKICRLFAASGKTRICRVVIGKLLHEQPVVAYDDLYQLPEKASYHPAYP